MEFYYKHSFETGFHLLKHAFVKSNFSFKLFVLLNFSDKVIMNALTVFQNLSFDSFSAV